jgi:hypothetical protein
MDDDGINIDINVGGPIRSHPQSMTKAKREIFPIVYSNSEN